MYLAVATRPEIAYTVNWLSQFNDCYRKDHWVAAKRAIRYLHGTLNLGLTYQKTGSPLKGFVDTDWANCMDGQRSYTGCVYIFGDAVISWKAKKQRTVAVSSTEAEYMGLAEAAKEALHLERFLVELSLQVPKSVKIYNANQGALKLARSQVFHNRTKHIDMSHHSVQEILKSGVINLKYLQTTEMIADVLTKGLSE